MIIFHDNYDQYCIKITIFFLFKKMFFLSKVKIIKGKTKNRYNFLNYDFQTLLKLQREKSIRNNIEQYSKLREKCKVAAICLRLS